MTNCEKSGGLLRQRQQQSAFRHPDRSRELPEQSRQGPRARAGIHKLDLRGGRLQSLLPEPLYELLTEYGPIHEVWFDGANPDPSVHEVYNYEAWYHLIRSLQPGAVIMGKGPDVRWVGNESGVGRTTEWSVIPLPPAPDKLHIRRAQRKSHPESLARQTRPRS